MSEYLIYKAEDQEHWDSDQEMFVTIPGKEYVFRYTLRNLYIWEAIHKKRFIDNPSITTEEFLDFIRVMCDDDIDVKTLTSNDILNIQKYIENEPTATVIPSSSGEGSSAGGRKKIYTSEILYAYMYISGVDSSWEDRNLNRLLVLINTIGSLQNGPSKMSKQESMNEQKDIIMERRRKAMEQNASID